MGLQCVELLMEVEDVFGISISDEDAVEMRRVQDMIDYVVDHVPTVPQEKCHTQEIYYRLRRAFHHQFSALAGDFRLDRPLNDMLHKKYWPGMWVAVRAEVGQGYWPERITWPGFWRGGSQTIRELVYGIAFCLPKPDVGAGEPWTRERIALEIRQIVSETLGIEAGRVQQAARFKEDLGI